MANEDIEDRKESIKLDLAEMLMKTIPAIPENIHEMSSEKQEEVFKIIDSRSERILELLGNKPKGRGPGRRPRRSERFNTPELDIGIVKKKKRAVQAENDEE